MRDDMCLEGEKTRFKKGQSGNPNGRPKGSRGKTKMVRQILNVSTKADNQITGERAVLSIEELITLAIMAKALTGDTKAYRTIMDSAYGKL